MKTVFLAGSKTEKWKDELVATLKISFSVPDGLGDEKIAIEKDRCDFLVYALTPGQVFPATIADLIQDSNRRPGKTILCSMDEYRGEKFKEIEMEGVKSIEKIVINNGAKCFFSLKQTADYLNSFAINIKYNPSVVECLIERDGPTVVTLGRNRYEFKKNDAGHNVCLVMLKEHRNYLINLPDYRIYMKDKLPEQYFTDEEWDFIRQWRTRAPDTFTAYVNGRIDRFNSSRSRVRKLACEKWNKMNEFLVSKKKAPMQCPIKAPDEKPESFINEWLRLNPERFEQYVDEKPEVFDRCSTEELMKAKDKWDRIVLANTGRQWPYKQSEAA